MASIVSPVRITANMGRNDALIPSVQQRVKPSECHVMTIDEIKKLQSTKKTEWNKLKLRDWFDCGLLQETWLCIVSEVKTAGKDAQIQAKQYKPDPDPQLAPIDQLPGVVCWNGTKQKESAGAVKEVAGEPYSFLGYTRIQLRRFRRDDDSIDKPSKSQKSYMIKNYYSGDDPDVLYYKVFVTGHVLTCFLTRPAEFIRLRLTEQEDDEEKVSRADKIDVSHLCHNACCCNPAHMELETHKANMRRQGCLSKFLLPCICQSPAHSNHIQNLCPVYHPDTTIACILPCVMDARLNPSFTDNFHKEGTVKQKPISRISIGDSDSDEDKQQQLTSSSSITTTPRTTNVNIVPAADDDDDFEGPQTSSRKRRRRQ